MSESKQKQSLKLKKITLWQGAAVILGILLIFSFTAKRCEDEAGGGTITAPDAAAERAVSFISEVMGAQNAELKSAELDNVDVKNNMYLVNIDVDNKTYPLYMNRGGNLLFLQPPVDLDVVEAQAAAAVAGGDDTANDDTANNASPANNAAPPAPEAAKSAKPVVEVFVMSHCPFGTQIEKGIIPVAELLGDKIDFSVKFVYYAMHGKVELDEQLLQHCIQEEEEGKYIDYLTCFLGEGDSEACLGETSIDMEKVNTCIEETDDEFSITEGFNDKSTWLNDRFPLFGISADLNEKYGVRGSPSLVINGAQASSSRDSASLLTAICNAFEEAPEECSTELSSASPSAGFGFEAATGGSAGSCG